MTKSRILLIIDSLNETEISWQCILSNIVSLEVQYNRRDLNFKENSEESVRRGALALIADDTDDEVRSLSSDNGCRRTLFKDAPSLLDKPVLSIFYRPPAADAIM